MTKAPLVVSRTTAMFQALATLLALGGMFWSVLLFPVLLIPDRTLPNLMVLGPGYVVTLGYIVRAATTPLVATRRSIWGASALVQGAWLAFAVATQLQTVGAGGSSSWPVLFWSWWFFATYTSVWGCLCDTEDDYACSSTSPRFE